MRIRAIVFTMAGLLVAVHGAPAQQGSGALVGAVEHPESGIVANAPVRARNQASGTDARTRSLSSGRFELRNLPAGEYVVSVHMPCCEFLPYVNESVVISEGKEQELAIVLPLVGLNVEGDDPAIFNAEILSRQVIPESPVPLTADGKPSLSGVWLTSADPYPDDPEVLPSVQPVVQERVDNNWLEHPHTRCLPGEPAFPGASAFMVKFVQTPELVLILFEDAPNFRQIFLDGRGHPEKLNPTWMGHSIGRWEGDTLVVDTVGFNDRGWTDIYPRTTMMRMQERYRRSAFNRLDVRVTIEDSGVFAEPWVRNATWDLAPQEELMEYVCENNKWQPED